MTVKECVFDVNSARRELQPHGTPEFPCAVYETRYTNAPGGDLCWHWHEDMEIWHVLEGRMELRLPGRALLLQAGDCAAINANTLHAGGTDAACRLRALVFSPALAAGERESVFSRRYIQPLLACKPFDAHRFAPEEAEEARAANIGERECLRCFQRTVRLSPMQYLLKYRVARGAEMLRAEPGCSVSQIAVACGFDSPSNFSKMFRRFYGLSPREYRQQGA